MKLWLDDVRDPAAHGRIGWTWVKTAEEAIAALQTGTVEQASLDHDLSIGATLGCPAPGEMTGYSVVCWMEEHGVWPEGGVRVHSMNPVGRQRMQAVIDAAKAKERITMNEPKWTPGEWRAVRTLSPEECTAIGIPHEAAEPRVVAEWRDEQGRKNTKWLAVCGATKDAQVMAAAPDLFEALEPLVPFMEAFRVGEGATERDYEFFGPFIEKARAALTKARGGQL